MQLYLKRSGQPSSSFTRLLLKYLFIHLYVMTEVLKQIQKSRKRPKSAPSSMHKTILAKGETRTYVLLLGRPQKIRSRRSYISVAVSGSQLIKLIKSVTSLVLKKQRKVTTIVCVFLRKAPTKKGEY